MPTSRANRRKRSILDVLARNRALFLLMIPGLLVLIINNYLPMFGVYLSFVNYKVSSDSFIHNLFTSEWVGFKNFEFFTATKDAFLITRNTVLYNLSFIALGTVAGIAVAFALNELRKRAISKLYQTVMFLPQFFSWVVIAHLVYAFLNNNNGFVNRILLEPLGIKPVQWYSQPAYWVFILPLVNIWKSLGYTCLIYTAAIAGIDQEMLESAVIDGATKWKQIWHIMLPQLIPVVITLTLIQIGRVFFADFGLFFQVTQNSGALYSTTLVIDTYVYNALRTMSDASMSSAVGLYQAVVGLVLVLASNLLVRRIDKSSAIF